MQHGLEEEKYSYSKLDLFEQCPYKYKLKYIDKNRSEESNIALEIGTLAHLGKEKWAEYIINKQIPDYNYIERIINEGLEIESIHIFNGAEIERNIENILGIYEIRKKYYDSYYSICNKTGMNYDEKFNIYLNNLRNELESEWNVLAIEKKFKIQYDKYNIIGFIDRVDINKNEELRVIDYKTSKEAFKDNKLATPLQMFIYSLACEKLYNKRPIEYIYDFVFLDIEKKACTKGYYERGIKKLSKIFNSIEECKNKEEYIPKPTPLCYWCEFNSSTPLSDKKLNHLCPYYCLWTPNNRTFAKNSEYKKESQNKWNKVFNFNF